MHVFWFKFYSIKLISAFQSIHVSMLRFSLTFILSVLNLRDSYSPNHYGYSLTLVNASKGWGIEGVFKKSSCNKTGDNITFTLKLSSIQKQNKTKQKTSDRDLFTMEYRLASKYSEITCIWSMGMLERRAYCKTSPLHRPLVS